MQLNLVRLSLKTISPCLSAVLELVPGAESLSARPIPAEPRLVALLRDTLDLATDHGPHLDPLAREALSRYILDLVALALGARGDTAERAKGRGLAAAQLMAMKASVLEMLADPGLSVATLAACYGVSVRYAQCGHLHDGSERAAGQEGVDDGSD
jgi:hypothetical protein